MSEESVKHSVTIPAGMTGTSGTSPRTRMDLLDVIRGITLISMICYHGSWDLVYIRGIGGAFASWYASATAFYWQQSICWSFVLLSGFCIPLSKHLWKRGIMVFLAGALVTAVTLLVLPEDLVLFGVLTFIGSAMLLTALLRKLLYRIPPAAGLIGSACLFFICRWVNSGYLQFVPRPDSFAVINVQAVGNILLPTVLYNRTGVFSLLMSYLGFMDPAFYSTDYFSVLPWIFLYFTGMFLHLTLKKAGAMDAPAGKKLLSFRIRPLAFLGRHSLLIYLLHQVVLYLVLCVLL